MEVLKTDRCMTANVWAREGQNETLVILASGKFTNISSVHPSHLLCSQGSSDCLGLVGQPVPIWEILIGSHTHWVESQKNPEHLLYLTLLYTKLIVILQSKISKMGLLGAISFSFVLVSLTQVNRIQFYVKTCKTANRYNVVLKYLQHVSDYIVFLIYRYPKVQRVSKSSHLFKKIF